jgi:DeoR family transcriptional regulator, aga operon transcriptional repressor
METRLDIILSEIERRDSVTVLELAGLLEVSAVTIRSDLEILRRQGRIHRTRGGATRPMLSHQEQPLEQTRRLHVLAKKHIGEAAAHLIESGDTLFMDVGSTVSEMVRYLPSSLQNVTVITNGLNIALELERFSNVTVVVTGGTLRPLQHSLVNPLALELLSRLRPNKAFLGCNGVSLEGISNTNLPEAEIKRHVAECSGRVYVLADHSKLGQTCPAFIAPLANITRLITDAKSHSSEVQNLRSAGLDVQLV